MKTRCKKLRGKKRRMRNLEFFIPKGHYCYGYREDGKWVHPCPFLRFDKKKDDQNRGICEAFKLRDSEQGGLLWDGVKECDVNDEYDEDRMCSIQTNIAFAEKIRRDRYEIPQNDFE